MVKLHLKIAKIIICLILLCILSDMKTSLQLIMVVAIMCGSIGGVVVASILKFLDNIVKVGLLRCLTPPFSSIPKIE